MFEYYCNNLLCAQYCPSKYEYNDLHKCLLGSSSPQIVNGGGAYKYVYLPQHVHMTLLYR